MCLMFPFFTQKINHLSSLYSYPQKHFLLFLYSLIFFPLNLRSTNTSYFILLHQQASSLVSKTNTLSSNSSKSSFIKHPYPKIPLYTSSCHLFPHLSSSNSKMSYIILLHHQPHPWSPSKIPQCSTHTL